MTDMARHFIAAAVIAVFVMQFSAEGATPAQIRPDTVLAEAPTDFPPVPAAVGDAKTAAAYGGMDTQLLEAPEQSVEQKKAREHTLNRWLDISAKQRKEKALAEANVASAPQPPQPPPPPPPPVPSPPLEERMPPPIRVEEDGWRPWRVAPAVEDGSVAHADAACNHLLRKASAECAVVTQAATRCTERVLAFERLHSGLWSTACVTAREQCANSLEWCRSAPASPQCVGANPTCQRVAVECNKQQPTGETLSQCLPQQKARSFICGKKFAESYSACWHGFDALTKRNQEDTTQLEEEVAVRRCGSAFAKSTLLCSHHISQYRKASAAHPNKATALGQKRDARCYSAHRAGESACHSAWKQLRPQAQSRSTAAIRKAHSAASVFWPAKQPPAPEALAVARPRTVKQQQDDDWGGWLAGNAAAEAEAAAAEAAAAGDAAVEADAAVTPLHEPALAVAQPVAAVAERSHPLSGGGGGTGGLWNGDVHAAVQGRYLGRTSQQALPDSTPATPAVDQIVPVDSVPPAEVEPQVEAAAAGQSLAELLKSTNTLLGEQTTPPLASVEDLLQEGATVGDQQEKTLPAVASLAPVAGGPHPHVTPMGDTVSVSEQPSGSAHTTALGAKEVKAQPQRAPVKKQSHTVAAVVEHKPKAVLAKGTVLSHGSFQGLPEARAAAQQRAAKEQKKAKAARRAALLANKPAGVYDTIDPVTVDPGRTHKKHPLSVAMETCRKHQHGAAVGCLNESKQGCQQGWQQAYLKCFSLFGEAKLWLQKDGRLPKSREAQARPPPAPPLPASLRRPAQLACAKQYAQYSVTCKKAHYQVGPLCREFATRSGTDMAPGASLNCGGQHTQAEAVCAQARHQGRAGCEKAWSTAKQLMNEHSGVVAGSELHGTDHDEQEPIQSQLARAQIDTMAKVKEASQRLQDARRTGMVQPGSKEEEAQLLDMFTSHGVNLAVSAVMLQV